MMALLYFTLLCFMIIIFSIEIKIINGLKIIKNAIRKEISQTNIVLHSNNIRTSQEIYKLKLSNFARVALKCSFASVSLNSFIKPKNINAKELIFPAECSESVVVLKKGRNEVVIIGTAHISDESAKLVQRTIRTVSPDVVMIELDPKRIGKFSKNITEFNKVFQVPSNSNFNIAITDIINDVNTIKVNRQPNLFVSVVNQIKETTNSAFQLVSGIFVI